MDDVLHIHDSQLMHNLDMKTFGDSPKILLPMMSGMRLTSVDQLITHLDISTRPAHVISTSQPAPYIDPYVFLIKFACYLCGKGHPSHANIPSNIVSNADWAVTNERPTFRAEQFLILATGSEMLPGPDKLWTINVSIIVC
jgi:hypothetical protein